MRFKTMKLILSCSEWEEDTESNPKNNSKMFFISYLALVITRVTK